MSSFAMPTVGDSVEFSGKLGSSDERLTYTLTSYDPAKEIYNRHKVEVTDNQIPQNSDESVRAATLPAEADIELLLSNCMPPVGQIETVTVPAGTFKACKMRQGDQGDSWVWTAKVPFGTVKVDTLIGKTRLQLELQKFTLGR